MSRFKVTIAKEQITRLREKYSKNANQEEKEESSSTESLISKGCERSSYQKEHVQQKKAISDIPAFKSTINSKPPGTVKEELDLLKSNYEVNDNFISLGSKSDVAKLVEKPISSESSELVDLSDHFEHIRFISSSSEHLSSLQSTNNQFTSVDSVDISEPNITIQNVYKSVGTEISTVKGNVLKALQISKISPSPKSLPETESNCSTISSVEELNSESESGNISKNLSLVNSVKRSTSDDEKDDTISKCTGTPNKEIDEVCSKVSFSSNSETPALNIASEISKEISTKSDEQLGNNNFKRDTLKHEDMTSVSLDKTSTGKIPRIVISPDNFKEPLNKNNNCFNKSTNTYPVKVISKNKSSKYNHSKSVGCRKRPFSEETGKHGRNKIGVEQDSKLKKSTRSFIKPCTLIRLNVIGNVESSCAYRRSPTFKSNLTDDFFNPPSLFTAQKIDCDEVIRQLMKMQINLTRHLMESHQQMYLQVCQAAQLLNESYSPTQ